MCIYRHYGTSRARNCYLENSVVSTKKYDIPPRQFGLEVCTRMSNRYIYLLFVRCHVKLASDLTQAGTIQLRVDQKDGF